MPGFRERVSALGSPGRVDTHGPTVNLAALARLSRKDLINEWSRIYRSHPPQKFRRELLVLGIAWKQQECLLGGLSAATKRQLDELARTMAEKSDLGRLRTISLRPGARLIREWDGETHEVLVVDDGFQWRGQIWASLSAIAREMTGTRWSGPRFFGLQGGKADGSRKRANRGRDIE